MALASDGFDYLQRLHGAVDHDDGLLLLGLAVDVDADVELLQRDVRQWHQLGAVLEGIQRHGDQSRSNVELNELAADSGLLGRRSKGRCRRERVAGFEWHILV